MTIRVLIVFSLLLILSSITIKTLTIDYSNRIVSTEKDVKLIHKNLEIIETFDKLFPGKWVHYLNQKPDIVSIREDLKELGFLDIQVKESQNITLFNGQVSNIRDITTLINFFYNSRGMVIKKIKIDQASKDIIIFNFALTY